MGFHALGDLEVVGGLGADGVGGAGIFAAVAGIEDDGAEIPGVLDEIRPQHWIDEFRQIHAGNVGLAVVGEDWIAENEFDAVPQADAAADVEFHLNLGVFEGDGLSGVGEFGEVVEALHAFDRDVVATVDLGDLPT